VLFRRSRVDVYSGNLTTAERDDYVKAVKCLMSTPSKLDAASYPGAKTRYDDFVVVHMNMTPSVHGTVSVVWIVCYCTDSTCVGKLFALA
jgi:hypothetical protein